MLMYLLFILAAVIAYLAGGVNGAIILSKLVYGKDIRDYGSNNPGFTNFKRVFGLNAATVGVFLIDILKAVIPVLTFGLIFAHNYDMWQVAVQLTGFFCMLGHAFPVWYGFKGGKAFLTGAAVIFFVDWRVGLIACAVFLALLFGVKYMSLASITAAFISPVCLVIFGTEHWTVILFAVLSSALIIARHHANISRLLHHTEKKFSLFSKEKQQ